MIGLIYIVFFVVYFLLSFIVVRWAYQFSQRRFMRGRAGALLAGFIMYNLVFWDWIPVWVAHKYYCSTQAGFWEYKSPAQWIRENPDRQLGQWSEYNRPIEFISNKHWRSWHTKDIYEEYINNTGSLFYSRRLERIVFDDKKKQIIARSINFYKINEGAISLGGGTSRDMKIWLAIGGNECASNSKNYEVLLAEYQNLLLNHINRNSDHVNQ